MPDTGDHPRRYAIVGLCKSELTETVEGSASIDIIQITWRDRAGGDKQFEKNRDSHSEVCMCGMSTQE